MHADTAREQRLDSISACLHKKKYWRLPLIHSPLIIYHKCTLADELLLAALFTFVHTVAREHAVCVGISVHYKEAYPVCSSVICLVHAIFIISVC